MLSLIGIAISLNASAGTLYRCEFPAMNIAELGFTKNIAIYNATKKCMKESRIPAICQFGLTICKETENENNFACQLNLGADNILTSGYDEREAKRKAISRCREVYAIPALCDSLSPTCLDLTK